MWQAVSLDEAAEARVIADPHHRGHTERAASANQQTRVAEVGHTGSASVSEKDALADAAPPEQQGGAAGVVDEASDPEMNSNRSDVVIATKAGDHSRYKALAPATIKAGVEEWLRRLHTDYIDHWLTAGQRPHEQ